MNSTLRTLAFGAAAMSTLAGFAPSAEAAPRFVGTMIVTAQTGTCNGNAVGSRGKVTFVPADVGDNGEDSGLATFYDWNTVASTLVGASFDATLRPVKTVQVWGLSSTITGVRIAFAQQSPAVITETTDVVDVTGRIKGQIGGTNCTVTFQMSVVRAVN